MTLLIAETGRPPGDLKTTHQDYPAMFRQMLAAAGIEDECVTIPVVDGAPLPPPRRGDALLITGSPAGVYEPHTFIAPLSDAIRAYAAAGVPMVGICFGHQIMAQALGGTVEKSVHGWGVGVHSYDVLERAGLDLPAERLSCIVSHQDQVTVRPAGARRVAGSAFCPNGVLAYAGFPGISLQMHPEFSPAFASALLAMRADRLPEDTRVLAEASLSRPTDRQHIAHAIGRFLKENLE